MYVNANFKIPEADAIAFVRERAFGVVTAIDNGVPVAVHVPLLVADEAGKLRLEAHVARANPIHGVIAASPKVLVVVSGADAYISPDWYVSADQVPTWNYRAVHLTGTARLLPREGTHAHVEALSLAHEQRLLPKKPWSTSKMTERKLQMMLAAIVPIEITVERIEAAFKLGQNREPIDAHEAARMLDWRGSPGERAVARAMRDRLKLDKSDTAAVKP